MNDNEKYSFTGLLSQIIECALDVHSFMGNGLQEVIYQRALTTELLLKGISFRREIVMPLGEGQNCAELIDFFVFKNVMFEIKAINDIEDRHILQTLNNLIVHNLEIGLLLNFGSKNLTLERVINKRYQAPYKSPEQLFNLYNNNDLKKII